MCSREQILQHADRIFNIVYFQNKSTLKKEKTNDNNRQLGISDAMLSD